MKQKYYNEIPPAHTCNSCLGNRDKVSFSFTHSDRKYIRKMCNVCRKLIENGKMMKPLKIRKLETSRLLRSQKRVLIKNDIERYFKEKV